MQLTGAPTIGSSRARSVSTILPLKVASFPHLDTGSQVLLSVVPTIQRQCSGINGLKSVPNAISF